jgi:hypothetical protein
MVKILPTFLSFPFSLFNKKHPSFLFWKGSLIANRSNGYNLSTGELSDIADKNIIYIAIEDTWGPMR